MFESVKTGLRRSHPVLAGLVGFEPIKTGLSRCGPVRVWFELVNFGLCCSHPI